MSNASPLCDQKRTDCFACMSGRCKLLTDTNFGARICPFYKTTEQCRTERKIALARLNDLGLTHLLDKYSPSGGVL